MTRRRHSALLYLTTGTWIRFHLQRDQIGSRAGTPAKKGQCRESWNAVYTSVVVYLRRNFPNHAMSERRRQQNCCADCPPYCGCCSTRACLCHWEWQINPTGPSCYDCWIYYLHRRCPVVPQIGHVPYRSAASRTRLWKVPSRCCCCANGQIYIL
jgi:hypothetical protein